jgi:peptide-methionine (S)-S-oxide reductase
MAQIIFALGCFWGAERLFWQQQGVYSTAVGYTGGHSANPTYKEVCTGLTGHAEAVLVIFNPPLISLAQLISLFFEAHNPTQGMRQGNDVGTQYRSGIYLAERAKAHYQQRLTQAGYPSITTEISAVGDFYYAEDYHQQYLAKDPGGYCGLKGCAVRFELEAFERG